jgi:hypothetical protein
MAFPINHANAANGIIALLNNDEILSEIYAMLLNAKPKKAVTTELLYEEYWHGWLRLRDIYLEHKAESAAERFITSPTTDVLDRAIYRAGELDGSFEQQMYSGEYPDAPWEMAVSIAMCLVVCWFRRLENAGKVKMLDKDEVIQWLHQRTSTEPMQLNLL